jgi:hypothetical protein
MEVTRKSEAFLVNDLNESGQQGWELVTITHDKDRKGEMTWTAFLKRPHVVHAEQSAKNPGEAATQSSPAPKTIVPSGAESKPEETEEEIRFAEE